MGQIIGVLIGSWLWYRLARWTARNVELTAVESKPKAKGKTR